MSKNNSKKIEVKRIAKLANLSLSDEEAQKFEKQLGAIVGYIEKLNELDTSKVEPTSQVTGLSNVFQENEEPQVSLSQEQATSGSKESHNGLFVVEQILEEK